MAGPSAGTLSGSIARARKKISRYGVSTSRTASYIQFGRFARVRAWKRSKCSAGRGSL